MAATKAKEKEMKEEKAAERLVPTPLPVENMWRMNTKERLLTTFQERITKLKDKRAAKAEKERYAKLAETMHRKRVDRLKRKEKRNKMIKS